MTVTVLRASAPPAGRDGRPTSSGARFFNLLGSPNIVGQAEICYGEYLALMYAMFGWKLFPVVQKETQCTLMWGGGGPRYWNALWKNITKAHKEGMKLIVIDPRGIDATRHADMWLRVRPGTDCALALAMIRHIIKEGLYDKDFVEKWCHGFEELRERVEPFTLEKAAEITWVPAEQIRQAAELYATSKPAAMTHGLGIEHTVNSMETLHAVFALRAITGNIDVKGGDLFTTAYPDIIHEQEIELIDKLSPEQRKKQLGADRFKILTQEGFRMTQESVPRVWGDLTLNRSSQFQGFAHAPSFYRAAITGKPYPLKAILTVSSNPVVTYGNSKVVYEALKNLDLYVVVDFFMTPSAQLADYVLPGATYLERPWIWAYAMIVGSEQAMPAVVPGQYERWSDYKFWKGLGDRLGQKEYWPWEDLEQVYDYRLQPSGVTFKEFMAKGGFAAGKGGYKRYEEKGFGTPTGKVELYSTVLEKMGYDPLPVFREPLESPVSTPDLAKEYPLILTTGGRFLPYYNAEHRQIAKHRKRYPWPKMEIHPETAKSLGIEDGQWVWIESPRGRCRQTAEYDAEYPPRRCPCPARLVVSRGSGGGTLPLRTLEIEHQYPDRRRSRSLQPHQRRLAAPGAVVQGLSLQARGAVTGGAKSHENRQSLPRALGDRAGNSLCRIGQLLPQARWSHRHLCRATRLAGNEHGAEEGHMAEVVLPRAAPGVSCVAAGPL